VRNHFDLPETERGQAAVEVLGLFRMAGQDLPRLAEALRGLRRM
jgi:hypothetical protein